jgi:hypothetical protein
MDYVTILQTAKGERLCKTIAKSPDGSITKTDYDSASRYNVTVAEVADLHQLAELLAILETMPTACIIRAAHKAGAPADGVARRKHDHGDGVPVVFREEPAGHRWLMIDFDKVPCPTEIDGQRDGIEYLVSQLPAEFHDASYYYQWSSSAGLHGWDTLSAHVWFWCDRPHTDTELCAWGQTVDAVDDSAMRTVQPLYTAAPVFQGMADPLAGCRSGLVLKASDVVPMPTYVPPPPPVYTGGPLVLPSQSFAARLAAIGPDYHKPIQSAIAAYVAANGLATDAEELIRIMKEAIMVAPPGKNPKSIYLRDSYLRASIRGAMTKYGNKLPSNSRQRDLQVLSNIIRMSKNKGKKK